MSSAGVQSHLSVQLVGGPTAILEYGGLRWLTDPALSPPGEYAGLTKLTGPAFDIARSARAANERLFDQGSGKGRSSLKMGTGSVTFEVRCTRPNR